MEKGYYRSKENIAHVDDLKERVFKNEIINVTSVEEEYGGVAVRYWRFGIDEQVELFFAKTKTDGLNKYFEKV